MSNRDSLGFGDMVPQDVVDIFAHEKQGKNGRKKRSRSLGRALGWLKGKRKKDSESSRHGLGPSLDLAVELHPAGHKGGHRSGKQAHAQGNSHAVPKRDDDDDKTLAPPLFQENVFIESSRPKYLEDLHTEALEGLKMMQQEETSLGVECQDNESTISAVTMQTDGECGGFTTDSTIPDTSSVVSVQSSVSTKSSRSGLTRQGSTFRPLNSGKGGEKSRSRRRHRKTVAGIPQHVRKELGLDRVGWMMAPNVAEEQLYNGESDYSSTTEGPESPDGASTGLRATSVIHPLSKDRVELHTAAHAGLDLGLLQHLDPHCAAEQRPQSLAAHWINSTSSLQQEPPSPVMSMSPQAAYMSKIIPNAVLPPSIDVVEISRGRSRNSVRTVSKSSLVLSSPAPSRASSRSSRTTSSKASTITSASRHNKPSLSDSNWSNSDSSDTLVSNSSTISTSSTPRQRRSQDGEAKEDKVSVHSNGKLIQGDDTKRDGQFGRSLSIMKAKRAPPPPSRSYSLHNKMKRRSRDLAVILNPRENSSAQVEENGNDKHVSSPVCTNPGYHADTSSLDESTESQSVSPNKALPQVVKTDVSAPETKQASGKENKLNNTISPSSGYSSREASSPQLSKQSVHSSPRHKKGIFAKLQRLFPGSSSSDPASSSAAPAGIPENAVDTAVVSPSVQALRELFNIPDTPKSTHPRPLPLRCGLTANVRSSCSWDPRLPRTFTPSSRRIRRTGDSRGSRRLRLQTAWREKENSTAQL
uniref:Uncharacterized protein n=1 Tax=Salarias fasciatus TaxID=181472 RepID=A0A672I6D1_SALFA